MSSRNRGSSVDALVAAEEIKIAKLKSLISVHQQNSNVKILHARRSEDDYGNDEDENDDGNNGGEESKNEIFALFGITAESDERSFTPNFATAAQRAALADDVGESNDNANNDTVRSTANEAQGSRNLPAASLESLMPPLITGMIFTKVTLPSPTDLKKIGDDAYADTFHTLSGHLAKPSPSLDFELSVSVLRNGEKKRKRNDNDDHDKDKDIENDNNNNEQGKSEIGEIQLRFIDSGMMMMVYDKLRS
jgi:hypothetical protein